MTCSGTLRSTQCIGAARNSVPNFRAPICIHDAIEKYNIVRVCACIQPEGLKQLHWAPMILSANTGASAFNRKIIGEIVGGHALKKP